MKTFTLKEVATRNANDVAKKAVTISAACITTNNDNTETTDIDKVLYSGSIPPNVPTPILAAEQESISCANKINFKFSIDGATDEKKFNIDNCLSSINVVYNAKPIGGTRVSFSGQNVCAPEEIKLILDQSIAKCCYTDAAYVIAQFFVEDNTKTEIKEAIDVSLYNIKSINIPVNLVVQGSLSSTTAGSHLSPFAIRNVAFSVAECGETSGKVGTEMACSTPLKVRVAKGDTLVFKINSEGKAMDSPQHELSYDSLVADLIGDLKTGVQSNVALPSSNIVLRMSATESQSVVSNDLSCLPNTHAYFPYGSCKLNVDSEDILFSSSQQSSFSMIADALGGLTVFAAAMLLFE